MRAGIVVATLLTSLTLPTVPSALNAQRIRLPRIGRRTEPPAAPLPKEISSGYSSGLAISVGRASIRHPSIPFSERAAHRCDKPLRSSTRQSNKVSPSSNRTAPALKTLLIGYGQFSRLRMGLPAYRVNKGRSAHGSGFGFSAAMASGSATGSVIGFKGNGSFRRAFLLRGSLWPPAFPAGPSGTKALIPLLDSR